MIRTLDTSLQIIVTYDDEKLTEQEALDSIVMTVNDSGALRGVTAEDTEFHVIEDTTEE